MSARVAGCLVLLALLLTSCAPAAHSSRDLDRPMMSIGSESHVLTKTLMDKPFAESHSDEIWRYVLDDGTTCYAKWSSYDGGWSCVRDGAR